MGHTVLCVAGAVVLVGALSSVGGPPAQWTKRVSFETVAVDATGAIVERRVGRVPVRTDDLGGGVLLETVSVPAGSFMMGTDAVSAAAIAAERELFDKGRRRHWVASVSSELPRHEVRVAGFWMSRFEVTEEQWRAVSRMPKVLVDLPAEPSDNVPGERIPVTNVSYDQSDEFCARLSRATGRRFRLPTEAEWEYACRAGTTTAFNLGPTIPATLVNFWAERPYGGAPIGTYREEPVPVGSLGFANAFGLFDMHGNVSERCLDGWHATYVGAPDDARVWADGDASSGAVRGGSWYDGGLDCRSASRRRVAFAQRDEEIGLRVVWTD